MIFHKFAPLNNSLNGLRRASEWGMHFLEVTRETKSILTLFCFAFTEMLVTEKYSNGDISQLWVKTYIRTLFGSLLTISPK